MSLRADEKAFEVLVLDGETRAALAAVRSLGGRNIPLAVASSSALAIAAKSKHCKKSFRLPQPRQAAGGAEYVKAIAGILSASRIKMLLPITDLSCSLVLENRGLLPAELIIPGAGHESFLSVSKKSLLLERAARLGLRVPRTLTLSANSLSLEETAAAVAAFPYPAVLKPDSSEQRVDNEVRKAAVVYVQNAREVEEQLRRSENSGLQFLLQQRIAGEGVGVFAICLNGDPLAIFCHRRILEKPPSGGRSVLSESIPEADAPVEESLRLLKDLKWDGVAMVEYKNSGPGEFFLMEINPRLWGSLQLAVDCGRDFPFLLHRLFSEPSQKETRFQELRREMKPYELGRRLRWDLGSIDHLLIRLKKEPRATLGDVFLRNSLQILSRPGRTGHETFRLDDPRPFFCEALEYAISPFR